VSVRTSQCLQQQPSQEDPGSGTGTARPHAHCLGQNAKVLKGWSVTPHLVFIMKRDEQPELPLSDVDFTN